MSATTFHLNQWTWIQNGNNNNKNLSLGLLLTWRLWTQWHHVSQFQRSWRNRALFLPQTSECGRLRPYLTETFSNLKCKTNTKCVSIFSVCPPIPDSMICQTLSDRISGNGPLLNQGCYDSLVKDTASKSTLRLCNKLLFSLLCLMIPKLTSQNVS